MLEVWNTGIFSISSKLDPDLAPAPAKMSQLRNTECNCQMTLGWLMQATALQDLPVAHPPHRHLLHRPLRPDGLRRVQSGQGDR